MKAFVSTGEQPWYMALRTNYPKPAFKKQKNSVLVNVRAVGLNPVDYKLPALPLVGRLWNEFPMGRDFAGVVVEVGAGDHGFKVGDEVYGFHSGTIVEYLIVPTSSIARKPASVTFVQAAALPCAALTSVIAFRDARLQPGARVLVIGASGGCGSLGVQIAKAMGAAHVTAVCSAKNDAFVRSLGADDVFAYDGGNGPLPKIQKAQLDELGFDMIYDTVTSPDDPDYTTEGTGLLRRSGHYVQINGPGNMFARMILRMATGISLFPSNRTLVGVAASPADLTSIAEWVDAGKLKIVVEASVPFEENAIREAFARIKARHTKGKLVVDLGSVAPQ